MKSNIKLTLVAAALSSAALASPAWAQTTTTAPGVSSSTNLTGSATGTNANATGTNANAGTEARLRAECFNAATHTWRTTGNCAGVSANGMATGTANATPPVNTAAGSAAYPSDTRSSASTQVPPSLKGMSNGSTTGTTGTGSSGTNSTGSSSTNSTGSTTSGSTTGSTTGSSMGR